ncbi:hypothetical protein SAMD00019534_100290 [Acytostelium subglobosum LB1]|uniref:hypothetical protein n=1 Tax=Acytostelium subglobosum LB1 TaxID=1410327 RepID=UPI00064522C4|nr:hypothetical protein SAMD00019534_100290 [Acytostelium subglobosum LB1]GAM26854.1 hypothetical protein SAMD00019534_100290 [Acytostelium subglobosum LB1]|eukprot:XP_012750122.1 hypothetical protein SAMD00019534_100290 [Acytostelium subglobosum LB1]
MSDQQPQQQTKKVLFACIQNAGRSQMSAALFNLHCSNKGWTAISAGTNPATHVHPAVVETMKEKGVDLTNNIPQKLTLELAQTATIFVTMGCGDACPYVPGIKIVEWQIEDPKNKPAEQVRLIRDDLEARIIDFIKQEGI